MLEYKVTAKQCPSKKHNFIVSAWKISAASEVATSFVCQNCLMTIDKAELETLNQYYFDLNKKHMDSIVTTE